MKFGDGFTGFGPNLVFNGESTEHSAFRSGIELSRASYRKMIQNLIWATAFRPAGRRSRWLAMA
jgi:hypothetical protein